MPTNTSPEPMPTKKPVKKTKEQQWAATVARSKHDMKASRVYWSNYIATFRGTHAEDINPRSRTPIPPLRTCPLPDREGAPSHILRNEAGVPVLRLVVDDDRWSFCMSEEAFQRLQAEGRKSKPEVAAQSDREWATLEALPYTPHRQPGEFEPSLALDPAARQERLDLESERLRRLRAYHERRVFDPERQRGQAAANRRQDARFEAYRAARNIRNEALGLPLEENPMDCGTHTSPA